MTQVDIRKPDEDEDEFDKIFFNTHGVGNTPTPQEERHLSSLDSSLPTYQEIEFVRMFFREGNITDAYIKAFGYVGNEHRRDYFTKLANRLINRPRVMKKLNEYRSKAQALADEDVAQLVHELNQDRELARAMGQVGAAISATKAKAQILGLEKTTTNNLNVVLDLTDDQKRNLLGRVASRLLPDKESIIDAKFVELDE